MTYPNRSKCTQSAEASTAHWEMEMIQADEEFRQFDRERAVNLISMLMRHHEICPSEFMSITANDLAPGTSNILKITVLHD